MTRNIALVISYDGTAYNGFQSQPSRNTIQDKLEEAVRILTGETLRVTGSGRTDAGVHARKMVVHFRTASKIPIERWAVALNSRLPEDIVVHSAREVPEHFHAIRSALRKTYRYTINTSRFPDPFRRKYEYHHPIPLDVEAMRKGLAHLVGEHDFTSFASPQSQLDNHVRTIYEARLELEEPPLSFPTLLEDFDRERYPGRTRALIHLYITGNGFLYQMVRIIAGTILLVGEGKLSPDDIPAILAAKDRNRAGPTAVPWGLTLWDVVYEIDF